MKKVMGYFALAFAIQGCATMGRVLGDKEMVKASQEMTPKQEYYLGRSISAQIMTENQFVDDKRVTTYSNTLGQYLALHSDRSTTYKGYRFAIVKNNVPTALSAPGGYIFLSTALVGELENEDELAAVIAHEIAHIGQKHANAAIKAKNRMSTATKWGARLLSFATEGEISEDMVKAYGGAVSEVVNIKYNKDQEIDADISGIGILRSAGYAPAALLSFLQRLKTDAGLLSQHPRSEARVNKIQESLNGKTWSGDKKARTRRFLSFKSWVGQHS